MLPPSVVFFLSAGLLLLIVLVTAVVFGLYSYKARASSFKLTMRGGSTSTVEEEDGSPAPTLTSYSTKLVAIYLSESVAEGSGENTGQTAMIYVNPQCEGDLSGCDVQARDDVNHVITDFFDLTDPSWSTGYTTSGVTQGSYAYVRFEFCKYVDTEGDPNHKCVLSSDPSTTHAWATPSCTTTFQLDNPLVVGPDEAVELDVAFATADVVVRGSGPSCDSDGFCCQFPSISYVLKINGNAIREGTLTR